MIKNILAHHFSELHNVDDISPERYRLLRRKFVAIMAMASIVPLLFMAVINYVEYQKALNREIQNPMRALLTKTKNTIELFLGERTSTISFIAQAYSFEDLSDERTLRRIFKVITSVSEGFVDLGLIDEKGIQVNYVGPYALSGKDYSQQAWFQQVLLKGAYVSDVFMGFRRFPHMVIAVRHLTDSGRSWVLRATIDTSQLNKIIAAMGLDPDSDAFLVNKEGVLQTDSNFYGHILDKLPIPMPPVSYEIKLTNLLDPQGRDLFTAYTYFADADFVLMTAKPRADMVRTWYTVKGDLLFIFVAGTLFIFVVGYRLTGLLIRRMKESDERRALAFRQVEHTQKLSSIGRLAAGVAHEINNPLAVINEKTGLIKDLLARHKDFPDRERILPQVEAILRTVKRCRDITHRMLGFAKRLEVSIEDLNVNEVLTETVGFLEKEATLRQVHIVRELDPGLARIASDRGQLQQVFLNILNNSLAAVADGGTISITTRDTGGDMIEIALGDNGCGMSDETMRHIFEPFFTTKKGAGTGLGLSITYGIVKRLGGEVSVQSKLKEGTVFTIYLPKKGSPEERP